MTVLIYLFKTFLISALLFAYYTLFLKNRPFHTFNRYFLLSVPVLSLLVPIFHFESPSFWNQHTSGSPIMLLGVGQGKLEEAVTVYANQHGRSIISWQLILLTLSLLITSILFIRLIKSIHFIYMLRGENPYQVLPDATVYFVSEKGTPFSFLKSIFWGNDLDLISEAGDQVLQHELFHVKNNHTVDILMMESLSAIFWFNPFYYLLNREIKAIHEYAADAWVTSKTDTYSYANLLLLKVSGTALPLTHPFFKNQLKRRIAMITRSKNNKSTRFGRFMILPLLAALICIFSFKGNTPLKIFSSKTVRVVIDAGHGGEYIGAVSNGILEKNINLEIAKRIQTLSPDYNVEVIMTRETDITPGSKNLKKSLEYIASLPKNKNADLFISIHTNLSDDNQKGKTQSTRSGFQIYIPGNSSPVYQNSLRFGSVMSNAIKTGFTIEPDLKQSADNGSHILILRQATVPAILIECGYMDNPSDIKYLVDGKNQDFIARLILEGIRRYSTEHVAYESSPMNVDHSIPAVDTLTKETLSKLNMSQISTMKVDKEAGLVIIHMKDGKIYIEKITPEMRHSWDSAHAAQMSHPDTSNPHKEVFTKVDVEAEYPGGYPAWYEFLSKNLKYPEAAVKKEIQGQVMIKFIVKSNGDVTDIRVTKGPEELKESSINVIKASGKWTPAKQNGRYVDSYHLQPINYKLEPQY
jgi:TonB family protein